MDLNQEQENGFYNSNNLYNQTPTPTLASHIHDQDLKLSTSSQNPIIPSNHMLQLNNNNNSNHLTETDNLNHSPTITVGSNVMNPTSTMLLTQDSVYDLNATQGLGLSFPKQTLTQHQVPSQHMSSQTIPSQPTGPTSVPSQLLTDLTSDHPIVPSQRTIDQHMQRTLEEENERTAAVVQQVMAQQLHQYAFLQRVQHHETPHVVLSQLTSEPLVGLKRPPTEGLVHKKKSRRHTVSSAAPLNIDTKNLRPVTAPRSALTSFHVVTSDLRQQPDPKDYANMTKEQLIARLIMLESEKRTDDEDEDEDSPDTPVDPKMAQFQPSEEEEDEDVSSTGSHEDSSKPAKVEGMSQIQCKWIDCGECFLELQPLITHLNDKHVGSGKPTYSCRWEGCPRNEKPFTKRHKMYNHLRTHTGERPFVCNKPGCGKKFSRPDSLTTHIKTHSNIRPFKCQAKGCGKAYYHSRSLKKHEKMHEVSSPLPPPYPPYHSAPSTVCIPHAQLYDASTFLNQKSYTPVYPAGLVEHHGYLESSEGLVNPESSLKNSMMQQADMTQQQPQVRSESDPSMMALMMDSQKELMAQMVHQQQKEMLNQLQTPGDMMSTQPMLDSVNHQPKQLMGHPDSVHQTKDMMSMMDSQVNKHLMTHLFDSVNQPESIVSPSNTIMNQQLLDSVNQQGFEFRQP